LGETSGSGPARPGRIQGCTEISKVDRMIDSPDTSELTRVCRMRFPLKPWLRRNH
jgi:hypothetical protein